MPGAARPDPSAGDPEGPPGRRRGHERLDSPFAAPGDPGQGPAEVGRPFAQHRFHCRRGAVHGGQARGNHRVRPGHGLDHGMMGPCRPSQPAEVLQAAVQRVRTELRFVHLRDHSHEPGGAQGPRRGPADAGHAGRERAGGTAGHRVQPQTVTVSHQRPSPIQALRSGGGARGSRPPAPGHGTGPRPAPGHGTGPRHRRSATGHSPTS